MPTSARLRHVGASPSCAAMCRPHHTATLCTSLGIPWTLGIPTNKMNLSRLRSPHVSVFVFRLSEGWSSFFQTSCAGCISRLCKYVAIKRVEMAPSYVVRIEIPRVTFKMRTKLESRRLQSLFATGLSAVFVRRKKTSSSGSRRQQAELGVRSTFVRSTLYLIVPPTAWKRTSFILSWPAWGVPSKLGILTLIMQMV